MDVSTFMYGYFIGLFFGALSVVWWTSRYGRVSLKSVQSSWREFADLFRHKREAEFISKRHQGAGPEESA